MNLLQLVQRLHRESGRAGSGPTTLVDASKEVLRLADKINDAWVQLQQEPRGWKWMRRSGTLSLAAGLTERTAVDFGIEGFGRWRRPTRHYTIRCLDPTNPQNVWDLQWADHDRFVRAFVDSPIEPGYASAWSIGPNEELLIAPAGVIDLQLKADWISDVTELVADADTPNMPARHHMLLVWRALVDAGKADAAIEDVSRATDALNTMLDNLISDQTDEIAWQPSPLA